MGEVGIGIGLLEEKEGALVLMLEYGFLQRGDLDLEYTVASVFYFEGIYDNKCLTRLNKVRKSIFDKS